MVQVMEEETRGTKDLDAPRKMLKLLSKAAAMEWRIGRKKNVHRIPTLSFQKSKDLCQQAYVSSIVVWNSNASLLKCKTLLKQVNCRSNAPVNEFCIFSKAS